MGWPRIAQMVRACACSCMRLLRWRRPIGPPDDDAMQAGGVSWSDAAHVRNASSPVERQAAPAISEAVLADLQPPGASALSTAPTDIDSGKAEGSYYPCSPSADHADIADEPTPDAVDVTALHPTTSTPPPGSPPYRTSTSDPAAPRKLQETDSGQDGGGHVPPSGAVEAPAHRCRLQRETIRGRPDPAEPPGETQRVPTGTHSSEDDGHVNGPASGTAKPARPEGRQPSRPPREIAGRRGAGASGASSSEPTALAPRAPRAPRAELMCRKDGMLWEVFLSTTDDYELEDVRHGPKSLDHKDGKCALTSLSGSLTAAVGGGEPLQIDLANDDRTMIFKLRADWQPPGRLVHGITQGHFIVVAPADWERTGYVPVEPAYCTDRSFRAHYVHRTRDGSGDVGFEGRKISLNRASVDLEGHAVFDDRDAGALFGGSAPPTLANAHGIEWARVGEEDGGSWPGENFRPPSRGLPDVLCDRQGRFYVRLYDKESRLLSDEFRYLRGLREVRVNEQPYTERTVLLPEPTGHPPTKVRFVSEEAHVSINLPSQATHARVDGDCIVVDPVPEADMVSCVLASPTGEQVKVELRLPRVWWRLELPASTVGELGDWLDKPICITRQEFREYAERDTNLRVLLPRRVKGAHIGFDQEVDRHYKVERTESIHSSLVVPLAHLRDYRQIDRRLLEDAVLSMGAMEIELPLIRVSRDPTPKVTHFSCHPPAILRGERTKLCWTALDAESDGVVIEPDIGPVSPSGQIDVMPCTDLSYTLRLTASGMEDVTETVTVMVQPTRIRRRVQVARVRCRHGGFRPGRGVSHGELRDAGMTLMEAKRRWIPVDKRRRTVHPRNAAVLRGLIDV